MIYGNWIFIVRKWVNKDRNLKAFHSFKFCPRLWLEEGESPFFRSWRNHNKPTTSNQSHYDSHHNFFRFPRNYSTLEGEVLVSLSFSLIFCFFHPFFPSFFLSRWCLIKPYIYLYINFWYLGMLIEAHNMLSAKSCMGKFVEPMFLVQAHWALSFLFVSFPSSFFKKNS